VFPEYHTGGSVRAHVSESVVWSYTWAAIVVLAGNHAFIGLKTPVPSRFVWDCFSTVHIIKTYKNAVITPQPLCKLSLIFLCIRVAHPKLQQASLPDPVEVAEHSVEGSATHLRYIPTFQCTCYYPQGCT